MNTLLKFFLIFSAAFTSSWILANKNTHYLDLGLPIYTQEKDEYITKLPSIYGSKEGDLWVLDARGERLIRERDGKADVIDLWLPGGADYAYVSDLVVKDGWIYFAGTFEDAIYKVKISHLKMIWSQSSKKIKEKVYLMRIQNADPMLRVVRQHFLRSGLWLAGQSRQALIDRAKNLSTDGWPVQTDPDKKWSVRYDPNASDNGQLCVMLDASAGSAPSRTGGHQQTTACTQLPMGWHVGAIYPLGIRSMPASEHCGTRKLGAGAKWLWVEVDLVGESKHSIESRTLIMRVAVENGELRCWDTQGFMADTKSSSSLVRVFALVGNTPTTLISESNARWLPHQVTLTKSFWPDPLITYRAQTEPVINPIDIKAMIGNALSYAQQSWTLPDNPAAHARYADWQKEGYFSRCFPEVESCAKPLGPRYLAQALVKKPYVGLPYGWGASDTPDSYVQRIAQGAYPGDIHTNNVITKEAAGVDCSGFITNVWRLPQRVVTTCRGGADAWTPKAGDTSCVGSFSSRVGLSTAQAGDALLIPGHVRLVVQNNEINLSKAGRGQYIEIIESSGFCAGACHRLLPIREAGRYRMMRPKL
jgi:hypothetical protein